MDGRVQRAGGALLAETNRGNGKDKVGAMTQERGIKLSQTVCTEVHENVIDCVTADRTGNITYLPPSSHIHDIYIYIYIYDRYVLYVYM
jgi:hypothetical protein